MQNIVPYLYKTSIEYREPFFGAGGVAFPVIEYVNENREFLGSDIKFWFNDKDAGIVDLWNTVYSNPWFFDWRIDEFIPSVDAFFYFQDDLLNTHESQGEERGFRKLAIHQMSYSGLGTKAGGPIGGKKQASEYDVGCRWNPKSLKSAVKRYNKALRSVPLRWNGFTKCDFAQVIDYPGNCIIYVDPPYFHKGNELYQFGMSEDAHRCLADLLRKSPHPFILSYDDCPEVRDLYHWADFDEISVNYSINGAVSKGELLIFNKNHRDIRHVYAQTH